MFAIESDRLRCPKPRSNTQSLFFYNAVKLWMWIFFPMSTKRAAGGGIILIWTDHENYTVQVIVPQAFWKPGFLSRLVLLKSLGMNQPLAVKHSFLI